mmetsp:Transcript_43258/g.80354  ORF Transcript_43258/g.80354 Transcript_43258/m.80354 type:complete len:233 (-) Transcript_43258:166-864(-)
MLPSRGAMGAGPSPAEETATVPPSWMAPTPAALGCDLTVPPFPSSSSCSMGSSSSSNRPSPAGLGLPRDDTARALSLALFEMRASRSIRSWALLPPPRCAVALALMAASAAAGSLLATAAAPAPAATPAAAPTAKAFCLLLMRSSSRSTLSCPLRTEAVDAEATLLLASASCSSVDMRWGGDCSSPPPAAAAAANVPDPKEAAEARLSYASVHVRTYFRRSSSWRSSSTPSE